MDSLPLFSAQEGKLGTDDNVPIFMKLPVQERVQILPGEHIKKYKMTSAMTSTEREEHRRWHGTQQGN